ncbi:MAG: LapA family protein [Nitrospiria bacterium]
MARYLFILVMTAVFLGVLYSNQTQMIPLDFFWGMQTTPLPFYLIVLGAFLMGGFLSALLFVPGWVRSMLDRRRKSRRIEQLEIDIDKLRSKTMRETAPALPKSPE